MISGFDDVSSTIIDDEEHDLSVNNRNQEIIIQRSNVSQKINHYLPIFFIIGVRNLIFVDPIIKLLRIW